MSAVSYNSRMFDQIKSIDSISQVGDSQAFQEGQPLDLANIQKVLQEKD